MTARSISGTPSSRYNAGVACADAPAALVPERAAVIEARAAGLESLTFAELAGRSSSLAERLAAAGVARGDAVGVFAGAGALAATAHVGVLKAGAVSVPLVPMLGEAALRHRIGDAGLRCLVVDPVLAGVAAELLTEDFAGLAVIALDEGVFGAGAGGFRAVPTAPDDPALILYTSGTTGLSKGAVLAHRTVLARQTPLGMIHGPFLPDDVFWTPAEWMWVGSVVDSVLAPLSHGCTVMTYERRRFEPAEAIERIKELGVTRAFIPPTALRQLADTDPASWNGHRIRSLHSGGEHLTPDAAAWVNETLGLVVDEIYGMTEASFVIGNAHRFHPIVPGSMGRPFPGQSVRVAGDDGTPAAVGETGELLVSEASPSLFLGYHRRPDATAARMRDGWFMTGDLVRADSDGNLFYVGRKDDLIMSSGHRIGPGEIEDVLRTHADVRDVIVVGEADAERGERVKAVVQLARSDGGAEPDGLTAELQDLVRTQVGRHAYPRAVEYVAEFPRTATGKVRRDVLRLAPRERPS